MAGLYGVGGNSRPRRSDLSDLRRRPIETRIAGTAVVIRKSF